jgi:hypothetical protein
VGYPARRYREPVPLETEKEIVMFGFMQTLLDDPRLQHWWDALRRSPQQRPPFVPPAIETTLSY